MSNVKLGLGSAADSLSSSRPAQVVFKSSKGLTQKRRQVEILALRQIDRDQRIRPHDGARLRARYGALVREGSMWPLKLSRRVLLKSTPTRFTLLSFLLLLLLLCSSRGLPAGPGLHCPRCGRQGHLVVAVFLWADFPVAQTAAVLAP